jgi:hypothetical protein
MRFAFAFPRRPASTRESGHFMNVALALPPVLV